ncbi:teichoic acid D-Ala incorporation-associated protein DltX [Streptococcus halichoeri]|nr:teichoic acid D-Ala incorporation-associated protein DltX [Streptococcus halichoeri]PZO94617.1 MAG: teichoic acid D-Ala incorporation-associated protein DltX [Streptococcus pyogenes]
MKSEKTTLNTVLIFIGKVLLFYIILMLLVYFFGYVGHGQGSFIYNEF